MLTMNIYFIVYVTLLRVFLLHFLFSLPKTNLSFYFLRLTRCKSRPSRLIPWADPRNMRSWWLRTKTTFLLSYRILMMSNSVNKIESDWDVDVYIEYVGWCLYCMISFLGFLTSHLIIEVPTSCRLDPRCSCWAGAVQNKNVKDLSNHRNRKKISRAF